MYEGRRLNSGLGLSLDGLILTSFLHRIRSCVSGAQVYPKNRTASLDYIPDEGLTHMRGLPHSD